MVDGHVQGVQRRSGVERWCSVVAALGVWLVGIAVGIGTLVLVQHAPTASLAGSSIAGAAALLIAGWLAITVGLLVRLRRPTPFATLLVLAGFAWFVTEWNSPGADSSVVFTVGLVFGAVCPALVAHAALAYPNGRLASRPERYAVVVAYVGTVGLLGLGPALVFDPAAQGCRRCSDNLVAISSNPDLHRWLDQAGWRLGVAWASALAVLAAWRVARSTPAARRLKAPILLAAVGYLGAVALTYVHLLDGDRLFNDAFGRRLWLVQAIALTILAVGVAAEAVRAHRARSAVAGDGGRPGPGARIGRTPRRTGEKARRSRARDHLSARRRPPCGRARHRGRRAVRSGQGAGDDRRRA